MKITPIDIAHKSFGKKMMGLDADEVNDFLQQIAGQMESLIQERNALKEAVREKELSLMEYKERDQVLKDTIQTATQMADRLRQDAERGRCRGKDRWGRVRDNPPRPRQRGQGAEGGAPHT